MFGQRVRSEPPLAGYEGLPLTVQQAIASLEWELDGRGVVVMVDGGKPEVLSFDELARFDYSGCVGVVTVIRPGGVL